MGRRGRKRHLDVEAHYWELLAAGVGTVAAWRAVGITRKTGYRWRSESGGLGPLELAEFGAVEPVSLGSSPDPPR